MSNILVNGLLLVINVMCNILLKVTCKCPDHCYEIIIHAYNLNIKIIWSLLQGSECFVFFSQVCMQFIILVKLSFTPFYALIMILVNGWWHSEILIISIKWQYLLQDGQYFNMPLLFSLNRIVLFINSIGNRLILESWW